MAKAKWVTKAASTLSTTANKNRKLLNIRVPAIDVELMEISWKSGIDSARGIKKISAPHWKDGETLDEEDSPAKMLFKTGSKRPGVYLVAGKKGKVDVEAKIKVTKASVGGDAILKGNWVGLELQGKFPAQVGEHMVSLKISKPPTNCTHVEGDASWSVEMPKFGIKPLAKKTRLEVFFLLDVPAAIYSDGVWVEALRLGFKNAKVAGAVEQKSVISAITSYCHSGHGMKYDTKTGSPHFGGGATGSARFQLMSYIERVPLTANTVNCYDQAAAVEALAGAFGAETEWRFIEPFGFIRPTDLVGVGKCNNPFFDLNGSKPLEFDPAKRKGFGNHAFVGLSTKILDACAGPHLCTETLRQYLTSAIDTQATVRAPQTTDQYLTALEGLPTGTGVTGII